MDDVQIDDTFPVDLNGVTSLCSPEIPSFDFVSDETEKLEIGDTSIDDCDDALGDSMVCDPNSRLVPTGLTRTNRTDETIMFINAGGDDSKVLDSELNISRDDYFEGGDVLRTEESIVEAGDFPFIYQSARVGNFCYQLNNLLPGEYLIDFHFAEIINTNGPKGIRVFNVYVQDEKVLAEFDIFSVVGANRPLLLVDLRVMVMDDGLIRVRFEGINGSPVVCGICLRKAPQVSVPRTSQDFIKCENCATEIEISPTRKRLMRAKAHDKYEKKIAELSERYEHKTNECHEAWMSLTSANEQLEKVMMELNNKIYQARSLDQTVITQADCLKSITRKYENDKRHWATAIDSLQEKIEIMKREQSQLSQEAHECVEGIPELYKMVGGVQALVSQCEDLKQKYSEEQAKRKELYNHIQETKGNIRVFCRCRPLNTEETSTKSATIVDFDGAKDGELGVITGNNSKKSFKFDRVYTPKDGQVDVFADASPMVVSVLDGYNVCIFAYGQTGTGKTFTMEGTPQNRGVNYRTVEQLFEVARERRETISYNISVSVLEVYNEQIRDLLATSPGSKKLEIKQSSDGSHHVPGLVEANVENINEVWNVLQAGSNARSVGSNNVNEHSSRSHCMLSIMVKAKNLMNGDCTKSKLWLVDLAGSERLAKTDVQGERLKEAQNINRSLSALGDVIYALATKSSHIPYRNSKLTHLLQDSLGGDSKTLMFVQISPSEHDVSETLSSLNFATRVRGVELGPARKQVDTGEIQKLKAMVEKARQESRSKDESIKKMEENIQNLEGKNKGRDNSYRSLQEKNKDLQNQLDSVHNQSEKQYAQLQERLKSRDEICSNLQQKVKELECKLRERHQSDSAANNQKVKDLENNLKESEGSSLVWQQKVKDYENKLKESEGNSLVWQQKIKELEIKHKDEQSQEAVLLRQKIKELEMRLKEQEKHIQEMATTREFPEVANATPNEVKTCFKEDNFGNENMESNTNILRTSNRLKTKRHDSLNLNEMTRKKRASRSGETENNGDDPQMKEKRIRKSDPPKVFSRVVRPTRTASGSSSQVPVAQKRVIKREQQEVPVVKEREAMEAMKETVEESLREMRETFASGRTRSLKWRKAQIGAIYEMVKDNEDKICNALFQDLGKHSTEAFRDELGVVLRTATVAINCLDKWAVPKHSKLPLLFYPAKGKVISEPYGTVLVLSSWNFPISLSLDPLIGAIAAGNTVLLKSSELSPNASAFLAKTIPAYLDTKAIKVIEGGPDVATILLQHQWDKIFFTGSPKIGRIIMAAAAQHLTPVTLELGGKCPTIVDHHTISKNIKSVVKRIAGGKWGSCNGQACISVDYVLIEKSFAPTLIDMLKPTIKSFFGENPKESGCLSRIANKHHVQRLSRLLSDPRVQASIVYGGSIDEDKLYVEPTILLDPPLDSEIMNEEIFGPILPIITVRDIQESIGIINTKPKPLAIYAFTNDENLKTRILSETSSGSVTFNDVMIQYMCDALPFGGVGESGIGRYHGKYSFDCFSHEKAIMEGSLGMDLEARYPPWNNFKLTFIRLAFREAYFKLILLMLGLKR